MTDVALDELRGRVEQLEQQLATQRQVGDLIDGALRRLRDPQLDRDAAAARKLPARISFAKFASVLPGAPALFDRRVPGEFTALVDEDLVQISCPCGETPSAECRGAVECACGRWFLNLGAHGVRVAFTPSSPGRALGPTSAPPVRQACDGASTLRDIGDGDGDAARAGSGTA